MNKKTTLILLIIILIGGGIFLILQKTPSVVPPPVVQQDQTTSDKAPETQLVYKNTTYGFNFTLPLSWKGYSVISDKWTGQTIDTKTPISKEGPKILIRHPFWTKEVPRQDIPVMVFTLSEWNLIQQEKLAVGAAPIGPSELGRNQTYVFALPARYNFAYEAGFEEVEEIINSKPLKAF